jgi:hypothetical protein
MSPFFYNNSFKLRMNPGMMAFMFSQGSEEIGYPSKLSRNTRGFIGTEATQIFINLPIDPKNLSFGEVHPLERTFGWGFKFDVNNLGGMISYNMIGSLTQENAFDPEHVIYNDWTGLLYWSGAFIIKTPVPGEKSVPGILGKRLIPAGTQRLKAGVSYSKLNYGYIDSLGFKMLHEGTFGESFQLFVRWEYLSDKIEPLGSYNFYHKWKVFFQANWWQRLSISSGISRSIKSGFEIGINFAMVSDMVFLKDQDIEYTWKPGYVVSPSITIRW